MLTMAVAAGAVGIEMLEALAIVLAVGVERRMYEEYVDERALLAADPLSAPTTGRPVSWPSRASSWRGSRWA